MTGEPPGHARRFWPAQATIAILGGLLAGCTLGASGQDLVESECTRCHTLAPIEARNNSRAEWDKVVQRLLDYGADLSQEKARRVVDYLAETYGPGEQ